MKRWTALTLVAVLIGAGAGRAQPAADLNRNAALKYWRAFALLPHLSHDEQARLSKEALTMPLDAKVKDLLTKSEAAFHELHNGAKVTQCAWGVTVEDGIGARLNELQAARALTSLAVLRIRARFAAGHPGALDDAWATLKLGRDASQDWAIIAVLVGIAIEGLVTETVAAELPGLHPGAVKEFAARVERLPPMGTVAAAVRTLEEPAGLDWFIRAVNGCKDRAALVKFLDALLATEDSTGQKGEDFLRACGGTKEAVLKHAEAARPFYRRWPGKMSLPPDQFQKEWDEFVRKEYPANPVLKVLFPALDKCRQTEARLEARQKLWRAAVAVRLEGRDALKNHPDPFGDGPFEYVPFEGGFELRSKLQAAGKPVALAVGRRKGG